MQTATASPQFVHRDLPSFMRAQLHTASCGGEFGYRDAGYTFGRSIASECPANAELDEWAEEVDRIPSFIDDDDALAAWLRRTFPAILARVPDRRMGRFMEGLRLAADAGHLRNW